MPDLDKLLEALDSQINVEDGIDSGERRYFWEQLKTFGCEQWVRNHIEDFARSHSSNQFSKSRKEASKFLQGSVYGYVAAKTGDTRFAVTAGKVAVEMAAKAAKHTP